MRLSDLDVGNRRSSIWAWAFILAVSLSAGVPALAEGPGNPTGAPSEGLLPVATASAAVRDLPIYVEAIGIAVASRTTVVRSNVEGRLTEIDFTAGQPVQTGDLLAKMNPRADRAGLERHATDLRAPASGVIGEPLRRTGDAISPRTPLTTISRIDPIVVALSLPKAALREIRRNPSDGRVRARAYGTDPLQPLAEGYLRTDDDDRPQEAAHRNLTAMFPNGDHALSPGMTVEVRLRGNATRPTLAIPRTAIRRSSTGYYTYMVTKSGTAHRRPLVLGNTTGNLVVVREGLRPGDVVVTDGQDELIEGSRVAIVAGPSPGKGSE